MLFSCVCVCVHVCVCAPPRTDFPTKHPIVFSHVLHIVDTAVLTDWRRVAKTDCPIDWCSSRVSLCSLLMSKEDLATVVRAGSEWRSHTTALRALVDGGSRLAESLFSLCVADSIEHEVEACFLTHLTKFSHDRAPLAMLTRAEMDKQKASVLTKILGIAGCNCICEHETCTFSIPFCVCVFVVCVLCLVSLCFSTPLQVWTALCIQGLSRCHIAASRWIWR